jgi:hypothetical protein
MNRLVNKRDGLALITGPLIFGTIGYLAVVTARKRE